MSGESIKRKTQGEDHRDKSVLTARRHEPGPLQLAQPLSSSLLLSLVSPPSHPIKPSSFLSLTGPGEAKHGGDGDLRAWHAPCLVRFYTPISWPSQADKSHDADGPHMAKRCFVPFFLISPVVASNATTILCLAALAVFFILIFFGLVSLVGGKRSLRLLIKECLVVACYSTCRKIP